MSGRYGDDQIGNIGVFSILHSWISSIYDSKVPLPIGSSEEQPTTSSETMSPVQSPEKLSVKEVETEVSTPTKDEEKNVKSTLTISASLQENIVTYILRVFEQCKLKVAKPDSSSSLKIYNNSVAPTLEDAFPDVTLTEGIRLADSICSMEPSFITKLFTSMKKNLLSKTTRVHPLIYIPLLQFLLNHGDSIVFDLESVFRSFFEEAFNKICKITCKTTEIFVGTNSLVAFETVNFFRKNKLKLLHQTSIFSRYFPPLLKILAWFPKTFNE
jgi:hypothetical protein